MLTLKCLATGSSGNCYILESDTEALIIEAGVPLKEVKIALGFNVRKIVGVVVSHSHGDHYKYHGEFEKAGIPVFDTFDSIMERQVRTYGNFVIRSFKLEHDVPCMGFHIDHPDMGILVYASDTEYIKYRFKNLNHILVEANHSYDLVDREASNYSHVLKGHMSLQTALDFISTNDNPNLRTVCLLHLSASNSDADLFLQKTKETVKYGADCYIAEKGLDVNLNLCPFM